MNLKFSFILVTFLYVYNIYSQNLSGIDRRNPLENIYNPESDPILPVTLLYFEGFAFSDRVLLRWGTATEINNYGFDIERTKLLPLQWETIGFEFGHGNSNSPKHYIFWDTTVVDTSVYAYRLKQINTDGTFEYTDTIHVNFHVTDVEINYFSDIPDFYELKQNYPNPFNSSTIIEFSLPNRANVSLKIFNTLGEIVFEFTFGELNAGGYSVEWKGVNSDGDIAGSGIYFYKLFINGENNLNSTQVMKMSLVK